MMSTRLISVPAGGSGSPLNHPEGFVTATPSCFPPKYRYHERDRIAPTIACACGAQKKVRVIQGLTREADRARLTARPAEGIASISWRFKRNATSSTVMKTSLASDPLGLRSPRALGDLRARASSRRVCNASLGTVSQPIQNSQPRIEERPVRGIDPRSRFSSTSYLGSLPISSS
jgi:hypothetical protein